MSGNNSCSRVTYEYTPTNATIMIRSSETDFLSNASLVRKLNLFYLSFNVDVVYHIRLVKYILHSVLAFE